MGRQKQIAPFSTIVDNVPDTCENCDYWERGECHRRAPSPMLIGAIGMLTAPAARAIAWPTTAGNDTCGDWKRGR